MNERKGGLMEWEVESSSLLSKEHLELEVHSNQGVLFGNFNLPEHGIICSSGTVHL